MDAPPRLAEDLAEDLGVLASMLGEERAYALGDEAVVVMERHRTADELALFSALFGLWAVCVGEREATAARWASLRATPKWARRREA